MNIITKPTALGLIGELIGVLPSLIFALIILAIIILIIIVIITRILKLGDSSRIWQGVENSYKKIFRFIPIIILSVLLIIGVDFIRKDVAVKKLEVVGESEAGILDDNFFVNFIVADYVPVYIDGLHKDYNRYSYGEFQKLLEDRREKPECVYAFDIGTDRRPRIIYKKVSDEIFDQLNIEEEYYNVLDRYEEGYKAYIKHNEIEI